MLINKNLYIIKNIYILGPTWNLQFGKYLGFSVVVQGNELELTSRELKAPHQVSNLRILDEPHNIVNKL